MMRQKNIFLLPLMFVFVAVLVSATGNSVTVSLFYDDTSFNSLTINNGDSFGVTISADSIFEDSMNIKLDLVDSQNSVKNLLEADTLTDSYSKHLIIGQSAYLSPGEYIIKGTVVAESGKTDTDELFLKVLAQPPLNHPPVITSIPVTIVNEGQNYVYDVNANDADGDALTYTLTQKPSWLSINSQTGLITGTAPEVNADTQYNVVVQVSDGKASVTQSYVLTVKDVKDDDDDDKKPSGKKGVGVKTLPTDDFYTAKYLSQFNPPIVITEEPEEKSAVKSAYGVWGKILFWLFIMIIILAILVLIAWLRSV